MKRNNIIIILLVLLSGITLLTSCLSNKYSKEKHIYTHNIGNGLLIEKYQTYPGSATTSDSYSYYITDSIHFRKFIGERNYDDEEIVWKIADNAITVYKKLRNLDFKTGIVTFDSAQIGNYKIDKLIKDGKFE